MPLIGYTPCGSPIFFGASSPKRGGKHKNPRYGCKACGAKTTKNQRKSNGNRCHQCKREFPHREGL